MNKEERLKEQRRKAQKKYWESHRDYYNKQSLNEAKRVRIERKTYKQALQDIKEYIRDEVAVFAFSEVGNMNLAHWEFNDDNVEHILDIVNKALGSDKE